MPPALANVTDALGTVMHYWVPSRRWRLERCGDVWRLRTPRPGAGTPMWAVAAWPAAAVSPEAGGWLVRKIDELGGTVR